MHAGEAGRCVEATTAYLRSHSCGLLQTLKGAPNNCWALDSTEGWELWASLSHEFCHWEPHHVLKAMMREIPSRVPSSGGGRESSPCSTPGASCYHEGRTEYTGNIEHTWALPAPTQHGGGELSRRLGAGWGRP